MSSSSIWLSSFCRCHLSISQHSEFHRSAKSYAVEREFHTPLKMKRSHTSRPASHLVPLPRPAPSRLAIPSSDMALDFEFESSDILGSDLPVGRGRVVRHSGFSLLFKTCALGVCTLFFLLAFRHGRTFFLRWKERHYRLYAYFAFLSSILQMST